MNGAHDWGQLALDIDLAARIGAPVLISAPAACAENLARAIAAWSASSHSARNRSSPNRSRAVSWAR